ncbi:hypothetical protein [Prolixibacter bellariivorans]|uniref:hypothetical protein n=1 Tax=Prolixibacter bellariivorans TaxID=314319 RepID=UPI001F1C676E|nr:hypothetical protein [Prolixibacter bellariivorans]
MASGTGEAKGGAKVPKGLDWDLFVGPAEYRPYDPAYTPWNWRGFWDFGTGALGDMACHIMDPLYWALDLKYPTKVWRVLPWQTFIRLHRLRKLPIPSRRDRRKAKSTCRK